MKQIKITKEQLDILLNLSNPIILHKDYVSDGDFIICEENNRKYIITESFHIGYLDYDIKDFVKITATNTIDLYNWKEQEDRCYPDDIYLTKISKLEQVLSSKNIDLNLLEHK